jgi:hypothetical protein
MVASFLQRLAEHALAVPQVKHSACSWGDGLKDEVGITAHANLHCGCDEAPATYWATRQIDALNENSTRPFLIAQAFLARQRGGVQNLLLHSYATMMLLRS